MSAKATKAKAGTERDIFLEALEKIDPVEQFQFVQAECGNDEQLRSGVEALLREHQQIGAFLDTPALAGPRWNPEMPGREAQDDYFRNGEAG